MLYILAFVAGVGGGLYAALSGWYDVALTKARALFDKFKLG